MTQADAEARELSRIAAEEFSALPRGIGDIHGAIADRVFGALGPPAAPVRFWHDAVSRGVYEGVRGGLWLTAHAVGGAARARAARRPALRDPARRDGDRRAQRPLRRPARGRGQPARDPDAGAAAWARPITPHVVVFLHGLGETEHAWGCAQLRRHARRRDARLRPLQHRPPHLRERRDPGRTAGRRRARLAGGGRADHDRRPLDGRPRRPQRLPSRRRVDAARPARRSRSARRTWAPRSSRPCTR